MLKEIIAQVEEARVGRAVAGLISGSYRFQVVQRGEGVVKGYVQRLEEGRLVAEFAVLLSEGGSQCSCRDCFVGGHACRHIALAALALLAEQAEAERAGSQQEGGRVRPFRRREAAVGA